MEVAHFCNKSAPRRRYEKQVAPPSAFESSGSHTRKGKMYSNLQYSCLSLPLFFFLFPFIILFLYPNSLSLLLFSSPSSLNSLVSFHLIFCSFPFVGLIILSIVKPRSIHKNRSLDPVLSHYNHNHVRFSKDPINISFPVRSTCPTT